MSPELQNAIVLGIFVFVVLPLFLGYLYSLRFIFQYRVEGDSIRIKLFGLITIRRILLNDIKEIEIVPCWSFPSLPFTYAEMWPSWVFTKTGVLVRKRTGLSRVLILTPENPLEFIATVKRLQSGETENGVKLHFPQTTTMRDSKNGV